MTLPHIDVPVIGRHYLLRLVVNAIHVTDAERDSPEFREAAEAWWRTEIKSEGLTPDEDTDVIVLVRGELLSVLGEVHRRPLVSRDPNSR